MHVNTHTASHAIFAISLVAASFLPIQAADNPKAGYISPASIGLPHSCLSYYPKEARENHITGSITLLFQITAQGTVSAPEVIKSSGDESLDAAARECASHWQYRPAMRDGEAVAINWRAQVVFDLRHTDAEKPQTTP